MRTAIVIPYVSLLLTAAAVPLQAQTVEQSCFSVAPSQTRVVDPADWAADPTILSDTEYIFTAGQYEPGIHVPQVSNVRLVAGGDLESSTPGARATTASDAMILIEGSGVDLTALAPAAGGGQWLLDGTGTSINTGVRVRETGACVALNRMSMSGMGQSGIVAGVAEILWVRRIDVQGSGSHGMEFVNVRSLRLRGDEPPGAPVRSTGNGGSGIRMINTRAGIHGKTAGGNAVELSSNGAHGLNAWLVTSDPNYIPGPYEVSLSGVDLLDNAGNGLNVGDYDSTEVGHCLFTGNVHGVDASNFGGLVLKDSEASDNDERGVHADFGDWVGLRNMTVARNPDFGMSLAYVDRFFSDDSTFGDAAGGQDRGLDLVNVDDASSTGDDFVANGEGLLAFGGASVLTVAGGTFTGNGTGVSVDGVTTTISGSDFTGQQLAVEIDGDVIGLLGNTFDHNQMGVRYNGTAQLFELLLDGNDFHNTPGVEPDGSGPWTWWHIVEVLNNTFDSNPAVATAPSNYTAIDGTDVGTLTIAGNVFTGEADGLIQAIAAHDNETLRVVDNLMTNLEFGLFAREAATLEILDNDISLTTSAAVDARDCDEIVAERNFLHDAGGQGLCLADVGFSARLANNVITGLEPGTWACGAGGAFGIMVENDFSQPREDAIQHNTVDHIQGTAVAYLGANTWNTSDFLANNLITSSATGYFADSSSAEAIHTDLFGVALDFDGAVSHDPATTHRLDPVYCGITPFRAATDAQLSFLLSPPEVKDGGLLVTGVNEDFGGATRLAGNVSIGAWEELICTPVGPAPVPDPLEARIHKQLLRLGHSSIFELVAEVKAKAAPPRPVGCEDFEATRIVVDEVASKDLGPKLEGELGLAEEAFLSGKLERASAHMCRFDFLIEEAIGSDVALPPATALLQCSGELSTASKLPRSCDD